MTMTEILPAMRSIAARLSLRAAARPALPVPGAVFARPASVPPLPPRVAIPVIDDAPGEAEARRHRDRGRHLARQENWEDLCRAITATDRARALTAGLEPVALLLAEGALTDVLDAARGSVARGAAQAARDTIASLEANLDEVPGCSALPAVVALAHVDLARLWRGDSPVRDLPPPLREGHDAHLRAAAALADRFDPFELDSPLWAHIRCAVLDADPAPRARVPDDYEDLIDLDPHCPDPMRALGRDLLPARHGAWEALDLEARRTAARTADVWGTGGYAWVWMGALECDAGAARRLDPELFVEGLRAILDRHGDQHMVNRLAAFTGITMAQGAGTDAASARIAGAFDWIVADFLTELHPGLWAAAPVPRPAAPAHAEPADRIARGRARAFSVIAARLAESARNGWIVIGPDARRPA